MHILYFHFLSNSQRFITAISTYSTKLRKQDLVYTILPSITAKDKRLGDLCPLFSSRIPSTSNHWQDVLVAEIMFLHSGSNTGTDSIAIIISWKEKCITSDVTLDLKVQWPERTCRDLDQHMAEALVVSMIKKWRVLQSSFGSIGSMMENYGTGGIDAVVDPW